MSQAVEAECQTEGPGGKEGTKGYVGFNTDNDFGDYDDADDSKGGGGGEEGLAEFLARAALLVEEELEAVSCRCPLSF